MANFNWADYLILSVFFFSLLAGLMRGLVREILSVVSWVVAFLVGIMYASPLAGQFTSNQAVQNSVATATHSIGIDPSHTVSLVAIGICFVILFIATFITCSVISYFISSAIESGGISIVNRLLGGVFGLVRGFLINLIMITIVQLTPLAAQAAWAQSSFVQSFQPAVAWLENTIQPGINNLKSQAGDKLKNINSQVQGTLGSFYQH